MKFLILEEAKSRRGITLIEVLVVIVIVGILASIAIPMYTDYIRRARRADAKTALEQIRAAQEMRRAERGSYSTDLAELRNTWGGPPSRVGYYNLSFGSASATAYVARATPTGPQAPDGVLTINQDGVKSPADKWAK